MRRLVVLLLCVLCFLCSCGESGESPRSRIERVADRYADSLGAVSVYFSDVEEGYAGYIDEGLIAAMLGDGDVPEQMTEVREYALICSAQMSVGEVWAIECYTYTGAREVYSLLEKRKKLLCGPDYEDARDAGAVAGATLVREGRFVLFAVNASGAEIVEYMIGEV